MSSPDRQSHRLDGLEPGNLLAFLALLGLLRALEEAAPPWHPRVAWSVDMLPVRPVLRLAVSVGRDAVLTAAAIGISRLAARHDFRPYKDLKLPPDIAAEQLRAAAAGDDSYIADLWAALVSDAAVRERNKVAEVEPTPMCMMLGQGHQHFLERLRTVPRQRQPERGPKRNQPTVSEADCLREALFVPWTRPDNTPLIPLGSARGRALRAPRHRSHRPEDEDDHAARRQPPRGGRHSRADGGPAATAH